MYPYPSGAGFTGPPMQRASRPIQQHVMRNQHSGGGAPKRKPEAFLQRDGKRHGPPPSTAGGADFERMEKDLRTLIERKCLHAAQICKDGGLTEMVRYIVFKEMPYFIHPDRP